MQTKTVGEETKPFHSTEAVFHEDSLCGQGPVRLFLSDIEFSIAWLLVRKAEAWASIRLLDAEIASIHETLPLCEPVFIGWTFLFQPFRVRHGFWPRTASRMDSLLRVADRHRFDRMGFFYRKSILSGPRDPEGVVSLARCHL